MMEHLETASGMPVPTLQDVLQASKRISSYLDPTPAIASDLLAEQLGAASVHLKCENLQPVGAFKIRGGINLVKQCDQEEIERGFVTASTGNHGQSIAYAAALLGAPAYIFVPADPNPVKVAAMERLGATVIAGGVDFDVARERAYTYAQENNRRFVHPVKEPALLAGVGTMTLEFLQQVPGIDTLFVSIGAGSSACSACIVAKSINPGIRVIGVQAEGAPAVYRSWKSGKVQALDTVDTLAEGMATRVAFDYPLAILSHYIDDIVLVSDEELEDAVRLLVTAAGQVAEEAGAGPLAAARRYPGLCEGRHLGLYISGGNIETARLAKILSRGSKRRD